MSAREFLERELRQDPNLSFAEVQERGRRLGLNIPPFLYGSARRSLGLPARRDLVEPTQPESRATTDDTSAIDAMPLAADEGEPVDAEPDAAPKAPAAAPKNSAFQFTVDTLKLSPDLSFQDLKTRAQMAGLKLQPIVYGRAKALLGLVPTKPRQPRKKVEPEAPRMLRQVESAAQLAPMPRPAPALSTALPSNLGSLEQLVGMVRELENDRQRLRSILAAIQAAVDEALAAEES